MHRQSSIPFNQSGIGVRAITMTAKTAPANAAAPITAAVFLLRFFFTALQISMAQTTQTAATASAITSVSHNHESSYNILIRSPYLSLANWKLLFHIHAFAKSRFIPLLSPPLRFWVFYNIPTTVDTRISVVPTFRTPSPFVSLFINTPLSNTFFLDTLFQM